MKIPFLWPVLGFTAGVLYHELAGSLPSKTLLMFSAIFALPSLWMSRGKRFFLPGFLIVMMIIGTLFYWNHRVHVSSSVAHFVSDRSVSLEGVVSSDPIVKKHGRKVKVSFVLTSDNLMRSSQEVSRKYKREYFEVEGDVQVFLYQPQSVPIFGDRVRMWGKLETAKPVLNPGGFDYGKFLEKKNIVCLFKAYGKRSTRILSSGEHGLFLSWVHQARMHLEEKIDGWFRPEAAPVIKAITLGRRQDIRPELRDQFMKTGTSHLLAISGLHLALISGSFYLLSIFLGFSQRKAACLTVLLIILQVLISGAGIPVKRAAWMATVGFIAVLMQRRSDSLNTFFFAFFIFIVTDPGVLTNLSFQLSFVSVFSLMIILRNFREGWKWSETISRTLIILVGTFPIVVYYFHVFSFVSLFANAIAIPLFHVVLLGTFMIFFAKPIPFLGDGIILFVEVMLKLALGWIEFLSKLDWGHLFLRAPSAGQMIAYYFLIAFALCCLKLKVKRLQFLRPISLGLWLVIAVSLFRPEKDTAFAMTLLAAGKNEMAHFQFENKEHWVFNTGRGYPSNQSRWILEPYLKSKGINRLKAVLLTDSKARHTGGIVSLSQNFPAQYLFYPTGLREKKPSVVELVNYKTNQKTLHAQNEIAISEKGHFQILEDKDDRLMIWISTQGWNLLWLSNLGPHVMNAIKKNFDLVSKSHIVILPTLSDYQEDWFEELMEYVDPDVIAIPHKQKDLYMFLAERDIPLFEIETLGALTFRIVENKSLVAESYLEGKIGEWTN